MAEWLGRSDKRRPNGAAPVASLALSHSHPWHSRPSHSAQATLALSYSHPLQSQETIE
jgi:hypothetical protein